MTFISYFNEFTNARERKIGGYSSEAGSFLARRDEAAWQVSCNEEQRRSGAIMTSEMGDKLSLSCTSVRERKFGGYFAEAGSFLARRDEAAWQVPCNEEQRRSGTIMTSEMGDKLSLSCTRYRNFILKLVGEQC